MAKVIALTYCTDEAVSIKESRARPTGGVNLNGGGHEGHDGGSCKRLLQADGLEGRLYSLQAGDVSKYSHRCGGHAKAGYLDHLLSNQGEERDGDQQNDYGLPDWPGRTLGKGAKGSVRAIQ